MILYIQEATDVTAYLAHDCNDGFLFQLLKSFYAHIVPNDREQDQFGHSVQEPSAPNRLI